MLQDWLIEIGKGIVKVFLNPLLYWSIIFVLLIGIRRIKQERRFFGAKVFDIFAEWKDTWGFSILIGIFYSVITIAVGMVFTIETIFLLSIVTIVLGLTLRLTLLSPSYTVGITVIILLIVPQFIHTFPFNGDVNFSALVILLALFLFVEAHFLSRIKQNETFPGLELGSRGSWLGKHSIKKYAIIPFFTLVPNGLIEPFAPYWPFLPLGETEFAIVLIPFVLGFDIPVKGKLPHEAANKLAIQLLGLSALVLLIAVGSIYIGWLTIVAVVIAIFGREYILFRFRVKDQAKRPYFNHTNEGLKILSIIPGSPADRLNIFVGETIKKVNGIKIDSEEVLYEALTQTGSFFKIELIDNNGEIRFAQSAIYEGDHHELGIIFASEPYRTNK